MSSIWKPFARTAIVALVSVGLVILGLFIINFVQGSPFQMIIQPAGSGASVQFVQPGKQLASPLFPVAVPTSGPQIIILSSSRVTIPRGKITFCDTTLLPGRFQIQFGESQFDVMERAVIVDNREYAWQRL